MVNKELNSLQRLGKYLVKRPVLTVNKIYDKVHRHPIETLFLMFIKRTHQFVNHSIRSEKKKGKLYQLVVKVISRVN